MRIVIGAILAVVVLSFAGGQPVWADAPPGKPGMGPWPPKPLQPPYLADNDGDLYPNTVDCNDDNAAVHPDAQEVANGIDDDCNAVIDDGFDTSVDWPTVQLAKLLWPDNKALLAEEMVSTDRSPRIVRTDTYFAVTWSTVADRLRFARVDVNGILLDPRPIEVSAHGRNPDITWTGSRLGIVYEDTSATEHSIRLVTLASDGTQFTDTLVAAPGSDPRIVWAQDRFGVVWRVPYCAGDCLRFQRFDVQGRIIGQTQVLQNSGRGAAIAFSPMGIRVNGTRIERHDGAFGIVYEAYYGFGVTGDVLLTVLPLEPYYDTPQPILVNEHSHPYSPLGARASIAANATGFAISWHETTGEAEVASLRLFSRDTLQPIQEFAPDADAGRTSNLVWTGSEFVVVNDNSVSTSPAGLDVHFRRLDPSCNSHLAGGWGPWQELNLRNWTPGTVSVNPDIARAYGLLGVVWVERDSGSSDQGRIWFASVTHK